jgi:Ca2+-binding RTX toxin-like protein
MAATIGIEYYEIFISDTDKALFSGLLGVPASQIKGQHTYLVFTDESGNEFILEGGPDNTVQGTTKPIATVAGDPLVRSPVGAGESGQPTKASRNYHEIDVKGDPAALWEVMKTHAVAIQNAGVTYTFFPGPNSNSAVGSMLNAIGINALDILPEPLASRSQEVTGITNVISTVTRVAQIINGNAQSSALSDTAGLDIIRAGDGNNTISWSGGADIIDGGAGIDTLGLSRTKSSTPFIYNAAEQRIQLSAGDSTITTTNIERLKFSDSAVAFDIGGNAGKVAKLLGAIFGKSAVSNAEFVGMGLAYLDSGMAYNELAAAALDAAGITSHANIVATLWQNIVGEAVPASEQAAYVKLLDEGMFKGDLAALAADQQMNADNIGLVGLSDTGLNFLPFTI